jgi:hypothetical protein
MPGNPDARYWWPDPDAEPVDPGPLPEGWVDVGFTEDGVSTPERDFDRRAMERYETLTGMSQSTDERIAQARRAIAKLTEE